MIDNVFLYLLVFLFTLILTSVICKTIIPVLKGKANQPIYEDGPAWHMSKSGTPTMGGISFLFAVSVALLICSLLYFLDGDSDSALSLLLCLGFGVLNSLIGIIDDLTKLRHRQNAGLTPRAKLILQFICVTLFLSARAVLLDNSTVIGFSFGEIDPGIFYYPLTALIIVGVTNFANLTDGIDGLAASVAFAIGVSTFYLSYGYFSVLSLISISLIGGTVGFLLYNVNPAKIFMGDTGSLFLGSLISASFLELNNPLLLAASGGVYVIEGLSVIIQVIFYKAYKKRIFKMAPIHHHLEKCGWSENKICLCAILMTLIFSIPGILLCAR